MFLSNGELDRQFSLYIKPYGAQDGLPEEGSKDSLKVC
jgi:hypothetical protein